MNRQIDQAVERLREGRLVAFPTETVYGLGADALNAEAVGRVFSVKGRPSRNPLIVHVGGPESARPLVQGPISEPALQLMRAFWPGPLSIVLPRSARVPGQVTGDGGPTVALRSPDHPLAIALLMAYGGPLVGPSANKSGGVSPTTAAHVIEAFADQDVMTLDGGPCQVGIESTVVRLYDTGSADGSGATILRPGVISAEQLQEVLGFTVAHGPGVALPGDPLHSPGLLSSHYSPAAPTTIFDDWIELEALANDVQNRSAGTVAVLSHSLLADQADLPPCTRVFALPPDAAGYAAALYATLRQADSTAPGLIAVHRPPLPEYAEPTSRGVWRAVHDRLSRASSR